MGLAAAVYARTMRALLPPGRLWRSPGGLIDQLLLGTADELARLDARADDLLVESEPSTATELLPEYETELELAAAATTEERRARVVAQYLVRQRFRPIDFRVALAGLLAQPVDDVDVIERDRAFCLAVEDDREIYPFFVFREPAQPGTPFISAAQSLVDRIAPAHTKGHVIESVNLLCDDPHSLCDRDILGA